VKPLGTVTALVLATGCSSAGATLKTPQDTSPPAAVATTDSARKAPTEVQPGFGTLKQDDVSPALRTGNLLIKVTPLSESVIRLTAPDTYNRLHGLAQNRLIEARRMTGAHDVEMFYVTFFSYSTGQVYQPQDVQLSYQGRILNPAAIIPVTPGWGKQQLDQQQTESAIYVFDTPLDFTVPITVRYGMQQNDDWTGIIQKLQVERAKVLSRKNIES
jgi:hypothetical protein